MEILGWVIWFLACGYGVFCFSILLYEIFWPVPYPDGPQVLYPFLLRRLIIGFEAFGFLCAAAVTALLQVSKFHLLWFTPVWHFWGMSRWIEWIYLAYRPELIDLIYPEFDIPWWFSLCCPFSPSLVPHMIRKIHKSRRRKLSPYDWGEFRTKFVNSTEEALNAEEFAFCRLAKRSSWPPKSLEEMNWKQRLFFWLGAGALINSVIAVLLLLLLLVYIILGLREAEEYMPHVFMVLKYILLMIFVSAVAWGFIYIFRDKK